MKKSERRPGPRTRGQRTVSGMAGLKTVHWLGSAEQADNLEWYYEQEGPLSRLLLFSTNTAEGLTCGERQEADRLILAAEEGGLECSFHSGRKALAGLALCRECAFATLDQHKKA